MNGHKYEATNPIVPAAPLSATVIAINDLVWLDSGASNVPKPASDFAWTTDLATTQPLFHAKFAGVALDRSRSGDTAKIRLATEGIFEFDCADPTTFAIGDYVGPAKQSGNLLENQKVAAVASAGLAIGRVTEVVTAGKKVRVRIASVLGTTYAGPQTKT